MGFSAAGFFGKLNENIDNQREYIRARVDEDRTYLRGEGLKRQAGIQKQRGQYEQAANELIRRGADEKQVRGLLQMDPKGLLQVHATGFTGAALTSSFSLAKDYEGEATMGDILNKIVPSVQAMPAGSSPEKVKRRSLGAFLGLDLDTELENEVYGQQIVGGMTGDDIMSTVGTPISAEGSNPSGVSYDLTRRKDTALTAAQRNGLFATANSDYTLGSFEASLETLEANEGETEEQLDLRKDQLSEAFEKGTSVERLAAALEANGGKMGPETKGIFDTYGSTLFNPFNGVNSDLFSTLSKAAGGASVDTSEQATEEEIRAEALSYFESNPTVDTYIIDVEGTPVTMSRSEVVTGEALDDNLDDIKAARTADTTQLPEDTLEAISPVASAFATQLELVADEATWLVTAVSAKLNQQLGEIASAFYKPAGEGLTGVSKDQEKDAEAILEGGLRGVLADFYTEYPDKKPVSKKKEDEAVAGTAGLLSKIDSYGKSGRSFKELLTAVDAWGKGDLPLKELLSKADTQEAARDESTASFNKAVEDYEKKYGIGANN